MNIHDCWGAFVLGMSLVLGVRMLWQAIRRVQS